MRSIRNFVQTRRNLLNTIFKISLPAIIEMGLNTLVGLADTLMISYLIGKSALAAVGFANQIVFTIIFIFTAFNTGATALIARNYGEKDYDRMKKIAGQALSINFLIGLVITALSYLYAKDMFNIYDVDPEVMDLILTYFYIVVISMLPMFLSFSFTAVLRGSGDTVSPMLVTGIANVLNIIGNYVLITGFGPFPKMGIAGAALSTTISRIIALIIYAYLLFIKDSKMKINIHHLGLSNDVLGPLWKLSYPGALEQFSMQGSFLVLGIIISQLNTNSEAAFRILLNIESVSYMPAVGISIASATLVGKALGEKDVQKAKDTGYLTCGMGIIWGLFMSLIFLILPSYVLRIFTPDLKLIALATPALIIAGFNNPFLNFMIIMGGVLRGAGDTKYVMAITSLRLWIVFLPFAYAFIIFFNQGVTGLWQAEILSFFIFSNIMLLRFKSENWTKLEIK
jgi:putative MATE family efflux protein